MNIGNKRVIFLIFLFIVGTLLRYTMGLVFPGLFGSGEEGYHEVAANLITYGVYGFGREPTAITLPLLPLMLALIYKIFGIDAYLGSIFCIFLNASAIIFIYLLAKEVFGKDISVIAAIITTIYPPFLISSVPIVVDMPFMVFIVISTYLLIKAMKINKFYLFILSGMIYGLSSLLRPEGMLFPFAILFFFAICRRNLLPKIALLVIFSILVELPWMLRNLEKFGYFGLSARGGLTLWLGAHTPHPGVPPYFWLGHSDVRARFPKYKNLSDTEVDKVLFKEAIKLIMENPINYMSLMVQKLYWLYETPYGFRYMRGVSLRKLAREGRFNILFKLKDFKIKLTIYIFHLFVLILGLVGIFYSFRLKNFYSQLLLLIIFYFTFVYLIFVASVRFNITPTSIFIIFSSFFIHKLFKRNIACYGRTLKGEDPFLTKKGPPLRPLS